MLRAALPPCFVWGLGKQKQSLCPNPNGGVQACASSRWSDLPPELLGLVLTCLHSLTDRVRAGAICRPWRSAARLHYPNLPPPMPWLALGDEAYLDVVNGGGAARKLSLGSAPDDNARCHGSADHLIFLTRDGGAGGCFLADPFTGAVLPVADLASFIKQQTRHNLHVLKVVLLWPPRPHGGGSSPEQPPLVAALIKNITNEHKTTIFVTYVAFFNGNLYALSTNDQLLIIGLGEGSAAAGGSNPTITGVKYVTEEIEEEDGTGDDDFDYFCQGICPAGDERLVQSGDRLLMLRRWVIDDVTSSSGDGDTSIFDVYEADFDGASSCRWKTASSLRGRALFLGPYCSKSVRVGDGHCGALEDCIYFVQHDASDSGIYDMEYCRVRPLVPNIEEVLLQVQRPWISTWIFPHLSP
ncbi:unnamed protein product [Urochloa decumbens]|uniref:DUF295 domain-containing protein n=1 Tax=Urochloa decumbens TaxID=240449 RepID=A0ABC9DTY2_9POAL